MSDQDMRRLERAAATGDPQAQLLLERARERAGETVRQHILVRRLGKEPLTHLYAGPRIGGPRISPGYLGAACGTSVWASAHPPLEDHPQLLLWASAHPLEDHPQLLLTADPPTCRRCARIMERERARHLELGPDHPRQRCYYCWPRHERFPPSGAW